MSDFFRAVRGLFKAKFFATGVVLTLGIGIGSATAVSFLVRASALRFPGSDSGNIIAVVALLLSVSVNLMALLLNRGLAHSRDIAVRLALGAPRAAILRQLLAECVCLGLAGGVIGLIIAAWVVDLFAVVPRETPGLLDLGANSMTVVMALGASTLIAVLVGLASYRASRGDIQAGLRRNAAPSGPAQTVLPRILVVAQFALSFVLLTDASTQGRATSIGPSTATSAAFVIALDTMALLLAGIGLNGLVAYSAGQRARDIGVRVALGARRLDVMSSVTRPGIWLSGLGLGIGLAGSIGLRLLMRSTASGMPDGAILDAAPFWRATVALALVAAVATYLPARHVSRLDPITALRDD